MAHVYPHEGVDEFFAYSVFSEPLVESEFQGVKSGEVDLTGHGDQTEAL
jgi:hypothetical protein